MIADPADGRAATKDLPTAGGGDRPQIEGPVPAGDRWGEDRL